jgi:hypothetical protein
MTRSLLPLALLIASPALAEGTRQLAAHEHGVGALNIAIDVHTVAIEFHAPGADIVGFEHPAESIADKAAIDAALNVLASPEQLVRLPDAANCSVTEVKAELEGEAEHEEHGHKEDAHDSHDDHGHDEHAEHAEDSDHGHADHNHEDHAEDAGHTEFHAEYVLTCANPVEVTELHFPYFDRFENAKELDVQVITGSGAQAFEVNRKTMTLDLRSLL